MFKPALQAVGITVLSVLVWIGFSALGFGITGSVLVSNIFGLIAGLGSALLTQKWLSGSFKPAPEGKESRNWLFWLMVVIVLVLAFITGQALGGWAYFNIDSQVMDEVQGTLNNLESWQFFLIVIGIAPLAEEALFRGTLYTAIRTQLPAWESALITTLIFAVIHANPVQALTVIPMSMVLAIAYEVSRRIWVVWGLHAAFNAASLLPVAWFTPLMDTSGVLILSGGFVATLFILNHIVGKSLEKTWPVKNQIVSFPKLIGK